MHYIKCVGLVTDGHSHDIITTFRLVLHMYIISRAVRLIMTPSSRIVMYHQTRGKGWWETNCINGNFKTLDHYQTKHIQYIFDISQEKSSCYISFLLNTSYRDISSSGHLEYAARLFIYVSQQFRSCKSFLSQT